MKAKMGAKSSSSPRRSLIASTTYFAIYGSAHIPHAEGKAIEHVNTIRLIPSDRDCLVFIVNLLSVNKKPPLARARANSRELPQKSMLGENNVTPVVALLQFLSFQINLSRAFQLSA